MSSNITEHPYYVKAVSSLEKTAVRDKLMRLVQYFSRFLSYYLYRKGYSKEAIVRAKTIASQLSNGRKLFRAGKWLGNIRAAISELHNQTAEPVVHVTTLVRNFGMAGYLFLDTIVWLNNTGIRKLSPESASLLGSSASRLWAVSLIAALVQALYKYYKADAKNRALIQEKEKDHSSLKLVAVEKNAAATQAIWNGLDLLIPLTSLGVLDLDDGVVGIAGTVTSWIGLLSLL